MNITINRKRSVKEVGDLVSTKSNKLYAIIEDKGEKYPYHLLCLESFTIIESYDELPSNQEIEEDIGEKLDGIYQHRDSHITLN
ncbi:MULTISPECIES: hypothetical protein [Bacillaceae]|jgi:hypothetical protein|uniref:Uncharacterized protein n=5 Tax=Alkalihalophilus TaxID=2893060 RepID=D3FUI4_ALKPO|nr:MULTISPECIES: hypothetical protein [Bacillaceae]ADC50154.1 hypothetical protein BpOF4_10505 [Alkalihalophilus pseudofirmus OF4]ERN51198.1 hypothetical protein A33I_02190 [Alkalihalophilus marmarensis DSM 21297]KMJ55776.1 hypothetical protein AB685_25475 [Bacillus sp. LL01]MCM3490278.1 hypothetical protein [Alkalihalophilus marmarensis]MDV2685818.1 hypothetical protein [Alkalihalophilus lindianensis]